MSCNAARTSIEVLAVFPQMGHLERAVHAKLQHFRMSGTPGAEWFACDLDEAVAAVMAVRRADGPYAECVCIYWLRV